MSVLIAEAATRTGLTAHTLRYYERDGLLLTPVSRDAAGRRSYSEGDLRWIEMVTCLRSTGMSIRLIKEYAELVRGGEGNEAERLALLHEHRYRVIAELREMTDHLGAIDRKIGLYESKVETTAASA